MIGPKDGGNDRIWHSLGPYITLSFPILITIQEQEIHVLGLGRREYLQQLNFPDVVRAWLLLAGS